MQAILITEPVLTWHTPTLLGITFLPCLSLLYIDSCRALLRLQVYHLSYSSTHDLVKHFCPVLKATHFIEHKHLRHIQVWQLVIPPYSIACIPFLLNAHACLHRLWLQTQVVVSDLSSLSLIIVCTSTDAKSSSSSSSSSSAFSPGNKPGTHVSLSQ